jgi:hypothetical protein
MISEQGVVYVVTYFASDRCPEQKFNALSNLCLVARHVVGIGNIVVGIGFTPYGTEGGFTNILGYFETPEWTEDNSRQAAELQARLEIFRGPMQKLDVIEYPVE